MENLSWKSISLYHILFCHFFIYKEIKFIFPTKRINHKNELKPKETFVSIPSIEFNIDSICGSIIIAFQIIMREMSKEELDCIIY